MTELNDLDKKVAGSTLGTSEDFIGASPVLSTNMENRAAEEPTVDLIGRAASSLTVHSDVFAWAERSMFLPDKDFNLDSNWNDFTKDIPDEYHAAFNAVRSKEEGMFVRNDILKSLEDRSMLSAAGFRGTTSSILGSIVDVDALITTGTGGLYTAYKVESALARAGIAGRANRVATTAVAGAEVSAALEVVSAETNPVADWTTVPDAALNGLIFGATVGTVLPSRLSTRGQEELNRTKAEFNRAKTEGFPTAAGERPVRKDYEAQMAELERELDAGGDRPSIEAKMSELADKRIAELNRANDSVGAASQRTEAVDPNFKNKDTGDLLKEVREANIKDGLTGDVWDTDSYFKSGAISQLSKKMYKATVGTPWADDFGRLWNSGSVIGQRLGTQLFESASGVGQMKNRTSAVLQNQYNTEIMAPVAQTYMTKFSEHLQETKSKAPTTLAWNDLNTRQAFDRAVMEELQYRYHDESSNPKSSKSVREMADAIDEASARAAEILKGRNGELPVKGAENLQATPGWYRQVWSGHNILKAINRAEFQFNAKDGRALLKDALSTSYQKIHKWDKKFADIVAGATLNGSIARSEGVNTNLFRTMTTDNGEYLRQLLENDGLSTKYVDDLMKRVQQDTADRGKIKPLKERNDVDLRTPIPGTDMTLMDLIDADINKTWSGYSRTAAGAASTARNGIQAHEIRSRWIPAIKDELQSRGAKPLDDGFYEALDSYFSGHAYSGGLNPWIRRMLTTTNLAFLNSLGLTQLGELGVTIGSMHLDNFVHAAPKELKYIFNGKLSPVHQDLKYVDSSIIGDHNIYRPELMQNETRAGGVNSELERNLDLLLAKGARVQGFVSGFYKINQYMQRMSGNMLIQRLGQVANGKKPFSELRAKSLGLTPANENKILQYFKDGTVEFRDGQVYDLHISKWDYNAFQEFAAVINRNSGQSVQKAFRGEDAWWMHRDTGAFLMHLKSFTFTALHKQLIRNMRIADQESLAITLFGLATAATAYTAKQYTSGNQDRLNGEKLMKGMLNYSNMTAPIVQFTDPVFGMLGMDSLQIGNFGNAYNGNNSLLSMPASFNAINRISKIPAAAVRGATGNLTSSDINALQAAPIVGNLYGMGYIANAMRDDLEAEKRKQKTEKEAKEKAVSTPSVKTPAVPPVKSDNAVINEVIKMGEEQ